MPFLLLPPYIFYSLYFYPFYFTFALISDKIFIYGQPYFWRVRKY